MAHCLRIPDQVKSDNRIVEDKITALCMLLARLAWPNRLADLHLKFGWKPERVSRTVNFLLRFIYDTWKHLLVFDIQRLSPERLASFTVAVRNCEAPLDTCFGFIDGTLRKVARPIYGQEAIYNGWKRIHCLKYQAIVTPDGIIAHLFGPVEGLNHDAAVLTESCILDILDIHAYGPNGTSLQIYGDPAYGIHEHLIAPFQGAAIPVNEQLWNRAMSRVRIVVEWCFKEILQMFTFLDFARTQQILLSPVGLQYCVVVLLHNAHVCLHHPQIPQYIAQENNLDFPADVVIPELAAPPTLEEYFH